MKIAHISDLHIDSSKEIIYGVNPVDNLRRIISALKPIDDIELVVVSGDIANDGCETSYILADQFLGELSVPVMATFGNHDNKKVIVELSSHLHHITFPAQYVLNNEVRFRFIDSVTESDDGGNNSSGLISKCDLESLENSLANDKLKNVLVLHHPSIEQGGSWIDKRMLGNREEFNQMIANSGNVIAVLSGHYHCSATNYIGKTLFSIAPGASTTFGVNLKPFEEAYMPGFDILEIDDKYVKKKTIYI